MKLQLNLSGSIQQNQNYRICLWCHDCKYCRFLQAGFIGSVVPKDYSFINSINVLIIVVFGGLGSITGAIVAAIVLGILNMFLQDVARVRMIIYALALVLVMIFRPGGLLGTWELSLSSLFKKVRRRAKLMALLEVKQLTKHFGGLTAVGDVTLELNEGELVGLIGPNGAGKNNLFNF